MKNFNKQIQITVELDSIANALLGSMDPENKHNDIIVEAIIGRFDATNDTHGMTALYNALNGFTNDINFQIGDKVLCTKQVWGYWTEASILDNNSVMGVIGECEVIDVNPYANDKVRIRFNKPGKKGEVIQDELWVSHTICSKTVTEEVINS